MNIKAAIIQYLANEFQLEPEGVTADLNFNLDLGLDNKQLLDLLQRLQESLGIVLPEERTETITTVGELLNLIEDDVTQ